MKILINAFGISDSGGITVLEKLLQECIAKESNIYYIFCFENEHIKRVSNDYDSWDDLTFIFKKNRGFIWRLFYENIVFRQFSKRVSIDIIYNFTGSSQFFIQTPQIIKIQNLLFYSKTLDEAYKKQKKYKVWLKQIWLKRFVFLQMIKNARYFDIQSSHVKEHIADFIDIKNKKFFIKSDLAVDKENFRKPKEYDFTKKIHLLYIVGPHFEFVHKNFSDFVEACKQLQKRGIDFDITITLTKEQLHNSILWNKELDDQTHFLGYVTNREDLMREFKDNTLLISTSIVETLGLHVIEAIEYGVLAITPNERYSFSVYGNEIDTYECYDPKSLLNAILDIITRTNSDLSHKIMQHQHYLLKNESTKLHSVVEIFEEVIKENIV